MMLLKAMAPPLALALALLLAFIVALLLWFIWRQLERIAAHLHGLYTIAR